MYHLSAIKEVVRGVILLLLVLPVVPIAISWRHAIHHPAADVLRRRGRLTALMLVSCSQLFLLAGMVEREAIGTDYSTRRYTTIVINLITMAIVTVVASLIRARGRPSLVVSSGWLTVSWLYVAAISSTV